MPIFERKDNFIDLYNSGRLPLIAKVFFREIENLFFLVRKDKKSLIETINAFNRLMENRQDSDFLMIKHFKKSALDKDNPW